MDDSELKFKFIVYFVLNLLLILDAFLFGLFSKNIFINFSFTFFNYFSIILFYRKFTITQFISKSVLFIAMMFLIKLFTISMYKKK